MIRSALVLILCLRLSGSVLPGCAEIKPITELISRKEGATHTKIMEVTGRQKHSVRGFISTAGKKHTIKSTKNAAGERTYQIEKV